MQAIIRLQNHGCKNHPYWWIVVAPRRANIKGRFIEHIGYWIPFQRKTVQRSIILNKQRALYWLAMGAEASKRVQRCLSFYDMMPKPLIKHGSKTLYEKPKKILSKNHFFQFQPYKSKLEKRYINEIFEQEDENLMKREMMIAKEALHKQNLESGEQLQQYATIEKLDKEWQQLRSELYMMEQDYKNIDPIRRELQFRKINELADQWKNERDTDQFKKYREESNKKTITEKNLKRELIIQNIIKKSDESLEDKKGFFNELKPMSELELHNLVEQMTDEYQLKVEKNDLYNEILNHAVRTNSVISKFYVKEYFDNELRKDNTDNDKYDIKLKLKDLEIMAFNTRIPVHPLPDITLYNPEDYTDMKKQGEQLVKNKAYSIPNVFIENDHPDKYSKTDLKERYKIKAKRGRSTRVKQGYRFSTIKECIISEEKILSLI